MADRLTAVFAAARLPDCPTDADDTLRLVETPDTASAAWPSPELADQPAGPDQTAAGSAMEASRNRVAPAAFRTRSPYRTELSCMRQHFPNGAIEPAFDDTSGAAFFGVVSGHDPAPARVPRPAR